ncbi:HAD family hydrolase [Natronomonas sp. EA1]|uniref:HAD family hydrolase n=1 Tax=Natronomonas sp. EA1 TaxID=3421655 RepID=UPI003EB74B43
MYTVGFDLDATLAVVDDDRASILAAARERVEAPPISREEYLDAHAAHSGSDTREPVFEALLADHETEVSPESLATAYREEIQAALTPVPGAAELVRALRADRPVGLLTDGPVTTQTHKLERLGWTALFDVTVVTGGLPAPKPSAHAFEALCDALGSTPGQTAYVGNDPVADIEGAAAAGLVPVQVLYEGGPEPHPDAAATVQRDAIRSDLPDVLDSLF